MWGLSPAQSLFFFAVLVNAEAGDGGDIFGYVNLFGDSDNFAMSVNEDGSESTQLNDLAIVKADGDKPAVVRYEVPTVAVGQMTKGDKVAEWASLAMQGTEFVHRPFRSSDKTNEYRVYFTQDGEFELFVDGESYAVKRGRAGEVAIVTGDNGKFIRKKITIKSQKNVVVGHVSGTYDYMQIPPAAEVIFGECSRHCYLEVFGAWDFDKDWKRPVNEECPNYDRSRPRYPDGKTFDGDSHYRGKPCKWTAPAGSKIAGFSYADGDGGDATAFISSDYFAEVIPLPVSMETLNILTDQPDTKCSLLKPEGGSLGTMKLITDINPGIYWSDHNDEIGKGHVLKCNNPVALYGDNKWEHGRNEELFIIAATYYEPSAGEKAVNSILSSHTNRLESSFSSCDEQHRFNMFMCDSHMCNDCVLDYCMKTCQEVQNDFPGCRCEKWPKVRASYSGGNFTAKGKFGDKGDYAKAASAFLSMQIKDDD